MSRKTFVIAEIGVNHNGDVNKATELVDAAVEAKASAVKFQTFNVNDLTTRSASLAQYQTRSNISDETQYSMLEKLQLNQEDHRQLVEYCRIKKIEFMSTAFDIGSLDFLVNELNVSRLKVASGEITNGPLLLAHGRTGINVILSTGMANLLEIRQALNVLAYGYTEKGTPSGYDIKKILGSTENHPALKDKVTLLQCTTQYPAPKEEANIRAMIGMREEFGLDLGYSDHTTGITAAIVAVSLGATVIEKHLTLNKSSPGPDQKASLEPDEFCQMVRAIEDAEACMGGNNKLPQPSEKENIIVARKSIVAAAIINKGDVFSAANLTAKRPGCGQTPMAYWEFLGRKSTRHYDKDELIV